MERTETLVDFDEDEFLIPDNNGLNREPSEASTEYPWDAQLDELMFDLPDGTPVAGTPTESSEPTSSYRTGSTTETSHASTTTEASSVVLGTKRKAQSPPVGAADGLSHKRARGNTPECVGDVSALDDSAREEPNLIAHDAHIQACMDSRGLRWAVQWEIARLTLSGGYTWRHFPPEALDRMKGTCKDIAPFVKELHKGPMPQKGAAGIGGAFSNEYSARAPWEELDREHTAFQRHDSDYAGLGSVPEARDPSLPEDWYGGKVAFAMKLVRGADKQSLRFELLQPELAASSRFTRRFGSDFIIRVRINKDLFYDPRMVSVLEETFKRPFVINNRVYRFFYANKERSAFLMATNERYHRGEIEVCRSPTPRRMSIWEFFLWHNPLLYNRNQTIAKWAARFALGLSNSVPGILLTADQIRHEKDIASEAWNGQGKLPSEMDMTDGCGYINRIALDMLYSQLGHWERCPIALQVRVCGAKGLLLLHPGKAENALRHPCVWLRDSQTKIRHPLDESLDPAHRTIEVLRGAHLNTPVRLSKECIINLTENGVPHECFRDLMQRSLEEAVSALIDGWDRPDAMHHLWRAVAREGGVMAGRAARRAAGLARVRGLRAFDVEDDDGDDEEGEDGKIRSAAWWEDEISGCPSSLEETVLVMLDAGFRPDEEGVLAQKLHEVTKKAIRSHVSKLRVVVPMGCSAFVVPDPTGKLKPGQIYFKSSHHNLQTPEGRLSDKVLGPALVMRNPVKLSRDVQKVEAVNIHELEDYVDVIVFPTQGPYTLASLLGGGDYDGDKVEVIWDPSIVNTFTNADLALSEMPPNFMESFERENKSLDSVLQDVCDMSPRARVREIQSYLLSPLRGASVVGVYSGLHDNAIYAYGYNDPETVRLAYMFCTTLDGSKTGMSVLPSVFRQDRAKFHANRAPEWKTTAQKRSAGRGRASASGAPTSIVSNECPIQRGPGFGKFVMDYLLDEMRTAGGHELTRVKNWFTAMILKLDDVLTAPWREAKARAAFVADPTAMLAELAVIEEHVHACHKLYDEKYRGNEFTEQKIEKRQDMLRELSAEFARVPDTFAYFSPHEAGRVRASYAYYSDYMDKGHSSRFPWNVAMRTLCDIKASSTGHHKTTLESFYHVMEVRKSAIG